MKIGLIPANRNYSSPFKIFNKISYSSYLAILLLFVPFVPCANILVTVGFAVAERNDRQLLVTDSHFLAQQ